jgi:multidrug efflux pump subunit AcrA (membrane-fusion protein)
LYGGVIKTLNVQIGSYVKKGQVIATIANPQFIQLQEEYLSTGSKITFAEQELQGKKNSTKEMQEQRKIYKVPQPNSIVCELVELHYNNKYS